MMSTRPPQYSNSSFWAKRKYNLFFQTSLTLNIDKIPRHFCGPHFHTQIHAYLALNLNKWESFWTVKQVWREKKTDGLDNKKSLVFTQKKSTMPPLNSTWWVLCPHSTQTLLMTSSVVLKLNSKSSSVVIRNTPTRSTSRVMTEICAVSPDCCNWNFNIRTWQDEADALQTGRTALYSRA